jgi:hypothetical protein
VATAQTAEVLDDEVRWAPQLEGKLSVRFVIGPEGAVSACPG